ncbi:coiled-coil domain-containing protein 82-like isoform X2 [Rhinoraja longicauda]
MAAAIGKYRTRARTNTSQSVSKSRIDRRRTRMDSISLVIDTDEEEESSSEKSEDEESMSSTSEDEEELNKATDSSDEEPVVKRKRLRLSDPFTESECSSDSEVCSKPIRKIKCNSRHICVQDDEEGSGEETTAGTNLRVKIEEAPRMEKELTIARKRKRQLELKRLSQRRRSQGSTRSSFQIIENSDEESEATGSQEENSSGTEWENDSLKDFIVFDEKDLQTTTSNHSELSQSVLAKHLPNFLIRDLYSHFQNFVKALLINAFDANFLKSLYEGSRKKKYAKEMLNSLNHVDERNVQMRLTNLWTTSRWKNRYRERVDSYSNLYVKEGPAIKTACQACGLNRTCRFTVILSGQLYDSKSLEQDSFMSNDKQVMLIGRVCAERTEVYHCLKHFKYELYQKCCSMVQSEDIRDENVKAAVNRIYKRLEEQDWIEEVT